MNPSNTNQKNEVQIDAQFVINALEERIRSLTDENIMLTAALKQMEAKKIEPASISKSS